VSERASPIVTLIGCLSSGVWSVGVFSVDMDIALWPPGGVASRQAFAPGGTTVAVRDDVSTRGTTRGRWPGVVERQVSYRRTSPDADRPEADMSSSTVLFDFDLTWEICDLTVSFHRSGGTP
jgi:hypothetical protein